MGHCFLKFPLPFWLGKWSHHFLLLPVVLEPGTGKLCIKLPNSTLLAKAVFQITLQFAGSLGVFLA